MRFSTPHCPCLSHRSARRSLAAASISAALATAALAQARTLPQNKGPMEEVLITGSFIKSTGEDEASPVEVLDNVYIENTGAGRGTGAYAGPVAARQTIPSRPRIRTWVSRTSSTRKPPGSTTALTSATIPSTTTRGVSSGMPESS